MYRKETVGRSDPRVPVRKRTFLSAGTDGSITLPADLAKRFGILPGAPLCIEELDRDLLLHRPITHLAKVYVEPTNDCPFACKTCMRRSWNEQLGSDAHCDLRTSPWWAEGVQPCSLRLLRGIRRAPLPSGYPLQQLRFDRQQRRGLFPKRSTSVWRMSMGSGIRAVSLSG